MESVRGLEGQLGELRFRGVQVDHDTATRKLGSLHPCSR